MKRFFAFLLVAVLCLSLTTIAYAAPTGAEGSGGVREGDPSIEVEPPSPSGTEGPDIVDESYDPLQKELEDLENGIPNVTVEDAETYLKSKGNDVVHLLQTVGKYVCIAAFIICCFLALIGLIGNRRMFTGALIGLIISGVAYAGIVCGPEIVKWVANWASTI